MTMMMKMTTIDDYYYYYYKHTDKVGTFEPHGHSTKCSIVHGGEYSITANLREEI
jgi:hypothetical protein